MFTPTLRCEWSIQYENGLYIQLFHTIWCVIFLSLFVFLFLFLFLFCFVLFCFVLFCFVLFCFVLFCFVLFCFVLFCFVFSGAILALLGIHMCDEVTIYGFGYDKRFTLHYYDSRFIAHKDSLTGCHDVENERNLWTSLHEEGIVRFFKRDV